jgi:hypothetical protein
MCQSFRSLRPGTSTYLHAEGWSPREPDCGSRLARQRKPCCTLNSWAELQTLPTCHHESSVAENLLMQPNPQAAESLQAGSAAPCGSCRGDPLVFRRKRQAAARVLVLTPGRWPAVSRHAGRQRQGLPRLGYGSKTIGILPVGLHHMTIALVRNTGRRRWPIFAKDWVTTLRPGFTTNSIAVCARPIWTKAIFDC